MLPPTGTVGGALGASGRDMGGKGGGGLRTLEVPTSETLRGLVTEATQWTSSKSDRAEQEREQLRAAGEATKEAGARGTEGSRVGGRIAGVMGGGSSSPAQSLEGWSWRSQ